MQIGIFENAEQAGQKAAEMIAQVVGDNPQAILGVATGSTPDPLYAQLRSWHKDGKLDLSACQAYALDEYVGIAVDHPERYRNVLLKNLVWENATGLKAENLHTLDGNSTDLAQAAQSYDSEIQALGGVDIQILGIGSDGHIAFNEPGGSLTSRTHIEVLTEQTRKDNARFFNDDIDQVPTHCLTQGMGTIMSAKAIVLLATGAGKAQAVKQLCEGAVSAFWPATILQMHNNVTVLVDEAAASKLELKEYYCERWSKL